jgi:hypothetical protein
MNGEGSQLVLLEGEPFLEYPDAGINTPGSRLKVGDGRTKYCDLPYLESEAADIESRLIEVETNYAIAEQGSEVQ